MTPYRDVPLITALGAKIERLEAEIDQLRATIINLAEENLQLYQIIDGYARAALEQKP